MRVLLPPSESKRPDGGNAIFRPGLLSHHEHLGHFREQVQDALVRVSSDPIRASQVFKLGKHAAQEIEHNRQLSSAHGIAAIERYVGVLFDAVNVAELHPDAREWINEHVSIQSALFGLISATDDIPPYRLSASTRLTDELGVTLKRFWNEAFASFNWDTDFILDLRSKDYAALAPLPENRDWLALDIVQRTADGGVRALNHFNKQAKGDLVRRLAITQARIHTFDDFRDWAAQQEIELLFDAEHARRATLVTHVGVPVSAGV